VTGSVSWAEPKFSSVCSIANAPRFTQRVILTAASRFGSVTKSRAYAIRAPASTTPLICNGIALASEAPTRGQTSTGTQNRSAA
jgi:hypothetical protein